MLALVGLVGLALCRDATGKGPACPGLECCTKKERGVMDGQSRKDHRKEGEEGRQKMEERK